MSEARTADARKKGEIDPVDRAAILLLALGEQDAARVLKHLDPREVQRVGSAMASLANVDMAQIGHVVESFLDTVTGHSGLTIGASEYIRRMLVSALGEEVTLDSWTELPADQRTAVQARVLDERPYPEIASELGTSETAVRMRVSRGLASLRGRLRNAR